MPSEVNPALVALLEGRALAAPPPPLQADEEVPVVVWREGDVAAVLWISRDPEDDEEPYSQDIEVFTRSRGRWQWHSKGGSDWPADYGRRPGVGRPALTGSAQGAPGPAGRGSVWLASGIAPAGVEHVRVTAGQVVIEADVEPVTGAFLVAVAAPSPLADVKVESAE